MASLFGLVNVAVPLWMLPEHAWQRLAAAVLLIATGVVWAHLACGMVEPVRDRRARRSIAVAGALVLALNAMALVADVPWRGDEEYHIQVVQGLVGAVGSGAPAFLLCLLPAAYAHLRSRSVRDPLGVDATVVGVTVAGLGGAALSSGLAPDAFRFPVLEGTFSLTRYPLLVSWLAAGPAFLWDAVSGRFFEAVYRVVPLLAAMALAWLGADRLAFGSRARWVLAALAVATIPTVFYYSSILYLELPAVAAMAVVCLHAEKLLGMPAKGLPGLPAWYALVLIGLMKETMAPFLAPFLLCRLALQVARAEGAAARIRAAGEEARVAFCLLAPLGAYLLFRLGFGTDSRRMVVSLDSLTEVSTLPVLARAAWEQYGGAAVAAAGGAVVLGAQRRFVLLAFLLAALATAVLFHLLDREAKHFLGYSRFLLPLAPMVLALAVEAVRWLGERRRPLADAVLAVLLLGNLAMAPIHLDGSKHAGWGQYRVDTAERYYPYRAALRHIQERYPADRTLITGMYFRYQFTLYTGPTDRFAQLPVRLSPAHPESEAVAELLSFARSQGYAHVLYHSLGEAVHAPPEHSGFVLEKVISNSANFLVLYSRVSAP